MARSYSRHDMRSCRLPLRSLQSTQLACVSHSFWIMVRSLIGKPASPSRTGTATTIGCVNGCTTPGLIGPRFRM